MKKSTELPIYAIAAMDLLSLIVSLCPALITWGGTLFYFRALWESPNFIYFVPIVPFLILFLLSSSIFLIRLLLPKLQKGSHTIGFNRGAIAWYGHLALGRAPDIAGLRPFVHSFYFTKYLLWRAAGMKVAYGVNSSMTVSFVDMPLITIGKGCTLSEGCAISCHTFVGNRLFLAPVEIGENTFIGMHTLIGPKSKIGAGTWIGAHNRIAGNSLPANTTIKDFEWQKGRPVTVEAVS